MIVGRTGFNPIRDSKALTDLTTLTLAEARDALKARKISLHVSSGVLPAV